MLPGYALQRFAGRGLRPNAVTTTRPCGEATGARARRSLDCGAVALAALYVDWPAVPEEGGRGLAGHRCGGLRGAPRAAGTVFAPQSWPGRPHARGPAFLFRRRHKMAAPGGGVTVGSRGARGSPPPVAGRVPVPVGLGGSFRVARGRSLPRQHRSAALRGSAAPGSCWPRRVRCWVFPCGVL